MATEPDPRIVVIEESVNAAFARDSRARVRYPSDFPFATALSLAIQDVRDFVLQVGLPMPHATAVALQTVRISLSYDNVKVLKLETPGSWQVFWIETETVANKVVQLPAEAGFVVEKIKAAQTNEAAEE